MPRGNPTSFIVIHSIKDIHILNKNPDALLADILT
jgi:hypothetical protein